MGSTNASPTPASPDPVTEAGVLTLGPSPSIGDHTNTEDGPSPHPSTIGCAQSSADATVGGHQKREDEIAVLARLVAAALSDSVAALRKDDETRLSQLTTTFQGGLLAFHDGEEKRLARLEKAIANLRPTKIKTDPVENFWTVYKKVADENDDDLVSKYVGDLDTSLLFAGLFSAVATAFIVQIIPQVRPDPADLTNALLLRILEQNTTFGGTDPLAPISSVPASIIRAQAILFASLSVTLFVAFIAVLGKQWILYYTRVTSLGNIVDQGKERQAKLMGLQKWGLHLIMESLPVMLQFALLLFGIALTVYLWGLDTSTAEVVLAVTSMGFAFYTCIVVAATIRRDCPFQTPLSVLLPKFRPWLKELRVLARLWLKRWSRRTAASFLLRIKRMAEHRYLKNFSERVFRIVTNATTTTNPTYEETFNISNPTLWRHDPLFSSPVPNDITASAGFWLLENSTDFSAASAVAAVFSEFQWPSHRDSTAALVQFRDAYKECLQSPSFEKPTRLRAIQLAAAYYVLYHTQLIWNTSKSFEVEVGRLPPDLPLDLFVHLPSDKWDGDDVFEYLLRSADRPEPVTSKRFLSYIAPYWFCGDSDSAVKFRPSRLERLPDLIEVLEQSDALNPATLTDCVLCVGAAMDFPLHPEDLIRVDKSDYLALTLKEVVDHIHSIALRRSRRRRHAKKALDILLTLIKKAPFPLVNGAWINGLLANATRGNMDDDTFTVFLKVSARRKEESPTADVQTQFHQEYVHVPRGLADPQSPGGTVPSHALENALFNKILQNVQACSEQEGGWQDEAVYGGLVAIRDIPRLGSCRPDDEFRTLRDAMEKSKPFSVRKAAYDVILAARDGWLKSPDLRETLERLNFPRQLHGVVIETGRSDHQRSFLMMMEILSEDRYWHSYLRRAMDIWLPFRREGPDYTLSILRNVGELPIPAEYDGSNPPLDRYLEKLVEDEWEGVPGRHVMNLTADQLEPLAEVTGWFKEILFTEKDRRVVLAAVEQVIPRLEKRREDGYGGPGEDTRRIIDGLLGKLRLPIQSTSRKPSYWLD